jgi:hypothetical protein
LAIIIIFHYIHHDSENPHLSNASIYSSYGSFIDKYIKFTYPDTFAGKT